MLLELVLPAKGPGPRPAPAPPATLFTGPAGLRCPLAHRLSFRSRLRPEVQCMRRSLSLAHASSAYCSFSSRSVLPPPGSSLPQGWRKALAEYSACPAPARHGGVPCTPISPVDTALLLQGRSLHVSPASSSSSAHTPGCGRSPHCKEEAGPRVSQIPSY